MNPYAIPPLITCLLLAFIGLFVYLQNRTSKLNILFSLFTYSMVLWLFGYTKMYLSNDASSALKWARIGFIGIIFLPILAYHFIISFLGLKHRFVIFFIYVLGIPTLLISQTNYIYNGITKNFWGYYPTAGKIYIFSLIMFGVLFTRGVWLLFIYLRGEIKIKKEQIKYVFLAFALGIFGIIDYIIKFHNFKFYPYGYVCALLSNSLIAYAIFRYRLLNINIALTRAGIFIFVYTLVLGIPFWIGSTTKSWFLATSLAVVLATLGPFIYSYLRRQAEAILLHEQHRYQATLRELANSMIRIKDLDQLLKVVVSTVVDTVKIQSGAIYLKDNSQNLFILKHYLPKTAKYNFPESIPIDSPFVEVLNKQKRPLLHDELGTTDLSALSASLTVPSIIENDISAFMLLGPKGENQMYTSDDVLIFETVSYSTSLAIENCFFWKEIEDRQRKARLQEMDTYSYSLAHEIDNPMQVIIGQADLLQKYMVKELNIPSDKQHDLNESFDYILEAARRVSGMVKAIRDFGQATTGEFKPLKISDVVESFSKLYYPQFKANSVVFQHSVADELGFVRGEKPELMQVLVILANNALHAMRYSREKKVLLKVEPSQNDTIKLSFKDSGSGIKKELLPIIFAPFTTTKASSEGTGMGLYNAQKIVNRHKGKIWVESEGENRGATFFIELPIAKDMTEEDFKKEQKDKKLF